MQPQKLFEEQQVYIKLELNARKLLSFHKTLGFPKIVHPT